MNWVCVNCDEFNNYDAKFCSSCGNGKSTSSLTNTCNECGSPNRIEAEECTMCGSNQFAEGYSSKKKTLEKVRSSPSIGRKKRVSFAQAIISGYKRYFDFSGRSTRAEFWWFLLFIYLVAPISLGFIEGVVILIVSGEEALDAASGTVLASCFWLVSIVPYWAIIVRRLHDNNASGWWVLIGFIPLLGIIALLGFLAVQGGNRSNKYGPGIWENSKDKSLEKKQPKPKTKTSDESDLP